MRQVNDSVRTRIAFLLQIITNESSLLAEMYEKRARADQEMKKAKQEERRIQELQNVREAAGRIT